MQIREFAESLLTADTLPGKLFFPAQLLDDEPIFTGKLPDMPERPPELAFSKKPSLDINLKQLKTLKNDKERGQILHFFANHELLAIELMALALLKFPHAPPLFRQHLLKTIADEQKHSRFYFQRMQECGVALGDIPLGFSFWNQSKNMNSPEEYICAMALTLEQANLDFALEYAERFQNVGDERSAKILNCVYQDELFHVRVGVEWMERWKKPEESQWDFHVRHLHFPLSPARAKSANLSVQARLDCGLTLDYIDSLSQFQRSKGRPPDVFFYNGLGETELTTPGALPNSRLELEADLESAMSLLACDDDVQIVRRHWSKHFKEQLKSTGRSVPETILLGEEIPHRLIGSFKPWMWTPVLRKNFRALGPRQTRTVLPEYLNAKTTLPIELLSSKSEQRALEAQLPAHSLFRAPLQQVVTSEDQLRNVLKDPNYATAWVLKSPLGCSGHGLRLGQGLDEIPWPWIKKTLAQQHQLIIEEQCQRWADYSLLGEMIEGQVRWLGHTRMLIDRRGVYKGALFGDDWRGFGDQHHRRLFCDGQPFLKTLQDQLSPILETWFAEHNFQGNFGVDCFIYKKDQQLYVRPLSEVNVRTTFGHLALQLQKRIKHGRTGIMFFCPQKYWDNLRQLNMECENGLWVNGIVACNDVWLAQQLGVFCWVGESCEQLLTEGNEAIKGEFSPILHHLVDAVF